MLFLLSVTNDINYTEIKRLLTDYRQLRQSVGDSTRVAMLRYFLIHPPPKVMGGYVDCHKTSSVIPLATGTR